VSNTYYQDELRYLRSVGPDFARANPEIARFLSDRGSDPDVERVLEGVAFLCGRIRQKLDDELPEFTASMMGLLWPHYLRPVPSMSVLELLPDIESMRGPLTVDAGAEFASVAIDGTRCRYRSAWPVTVRPWGLRNVRLETEAAKPVRLILQFKTGSAAKLEDLNLREVQLHLAGDLGDAFALYLLLAGHVARVTVSDGSSRHDRAELALDASCVSAGGLDRERGVLPYPAHSFPGYRLLQEYFAFKERFLFIDVRGLDRAVRRLGLEDSLEVAFTFNRRLETFPLISRDHVRLHCVPIINLFAHAADPVRLRHDRVQYLVHPAKSGVADRRHAEVYGVDRVYGVRRAAEMETCEYRSFFSFAHLAEGDARQATYYQTHVVPNVIGADASRFGTDTYISFVTPAAEGRMPQEETASLELTCTNRHLPAELRAGDIREPTDRSPAGVAFRNLTKPTATISPPLGRGLHWRLISHMSLNYVSLTDAAHFRELLRVYDFQHEHDGQLARAHQRLVEGIHSVRSRYGERMMRGAPIRGMCVDVELDEDHFAGEGDAFLFASVLDRFFGLYVTLNAYSQLTVRFTRSGQVHTFAPRWGDQATPAPARDNGGNHG
jgi:type VI secretion system protein ImpG